jgi:hypothetical protein
MNPSKQEMQCCLNQCDKSGRFGTPGWFKLFLCGRKVALVSALERDASGPSRGVWRVHARSGLRARQAALRGDDRRGLGSPLELGAVGRRGSPKGGRTP